MNQPEAARAASIGFFDGVHRGHQYLVQQVTAEAQRRNLEPLLITFAQHPATVLRPDVQMPLLTTPEEKAELLHKLGVERIEMLRFDHELAQLSAAEFMRSVLRDRLGVSVLVMGYDHHFGHDRGLSFADYVALGKEIGIEVVHAGELAAPDLPNRSISSSLIRRALAAGDLQLANQCLGYEYFLRGKVVGGLQLGRKLGYPTANIRPGSDGKLLPRRGVYAVDVCIEGHETARGMLNIGTRPTLQHTDAAAQTAQQQSIEVHIFDFHQDIYSENIEIRFRKFIREEREFPTLELLQKQLARDEQACRQ